ncbi:MAG: MerR family transcriptional regulator [Herbinix sp.]|jgi:DNA-binding transcriptional MerR regulator|nr:MerR family transcriptional regulator [Herbinix sp.]
MTTFTVKQLSDKYNISVHTIRFYDDQGLFPDVTRDLHGTRLFTEAHLEWINLVLCLRNTGMSIADIKHFVELCKLGDSTNLERYNIIITQKKKAEEDLKEMQKRLEVLSHKENYYGNKCGITSPM